MKTNNSLSKQLEENNRLHENGLKIFRAFMEAVTTNKEQALVEIENSDGTTSEIRIPSNVFLSTELDRFSQSLKNITGLLDKSQNAIISTDDSTSFREIIATDYKRSFELAKRNEITVDKNIIVSENDIIDKMISPLTAVNLSLSARFLNADRLKYTKFTLSSPDDISNFTEGMSYAEVQQRLSTITHNRLDSYINIDSRAARFYGTFSVINVEATDNNTFKLHTDKVSYSDINNVVQDSRELTAGDKLVTADGLCQLSVINVDSVKNIIEVRKEAGYGSIKPGIDAVSFLHINSEEKRTVRIPLKLGEKSILFLSVVNKYTNVESAYSEAIILDSDVFTVVENNVEYTFNEYFSAKVVDLGKFFEAYVRENTIPASLGIKPEKPLLSADYFKVVQINKHITDTPSTNKLKSLQKEKTTVYSEIQRLNDQIQNLNTRIIAGNYKTTSDKKRDISSRNAKISEKNIKSELYRTIVQDINTAVETSAINKTSPKFRIRGFWPVAKDTYSNATGYQKVIQYEVRYRYIGNTSNFSETQNISFTDENGNELTGAISPWNQLMTVPLKKVLVDGNLTWQTNTIQDSDQLNINQLDIAINSGESVQIQIRAISEAGYPVSPVTSDWSDIVTVEFPEELLISSDISAITKENENDLLKVQIQKEFSSQGITEHTQNSITEQERYFAHPSKDIASGYLTEEQKIISLFDYLQSLTNRIATLESRLERRSAKLTLEILGLDGNVYTINSFSTHNLFAGYYTDEVDMSNPSEHGTIVEKVFYLRLQNNNPETVEIQSLSPGALNTATDKDKYTKVSLSSLSDRETPKTQLNGQILYIRNKDLSGNIDYFVEDNSVSDTFVAAEDINHLATAPEKVLVDMSPSGSIDSVAINSSANLENYVVIHKQHPDYLAYIESNSSQEAAAVLAAEFNRLSKMNRTYRADTVQNVYDPNRSTEFIRNDKYTVGKNSIGARLFMRPNDIRNLQVNGIDSSSIKEIQSYSENAILIPLVFQYRMSDALGNVRGDTSLNTNSNFTFTKSIGIDLIVGGNVFSFDINVSAKFRPTAISNNNSNIRTVSGSIDPLSSSNAKIL